MTTDLEKIQKKLEKKLKKERYQHTLGVMYTAGSLAMRYNENLEEALTAGLLHDCGKYCAVKDQIKLCQKHHIQLTPAELETPALIHAKLGAYLAEKKYGIENPRVLDAIRYHTTGRPHMSMMDKIIYLADYIEPNRKIIPGLAMIRQLSFTNIEQAVCQCANSTLKYLEKSRRFIDPMTQQTYEYYKNNNDQIKKETKGE